jgi:hypothetical protein
MSTKSIFSDPIDLSGHSSKERISIMATELSVCENYQAMGYNSSNGQNIPQRMQDLEREITRQEDMEKRRVR